MKFIILILSVIALSGCVSSTGPDQCLRREIFDQCMSKVPPGPLVTHYNDWAEVVNQCENTAFYQSLRKLTIIKEECKIK